VRISRASRQSYVTETRRDGAEVRTDARVETAVRLDKKSFEKAGLAVSAEESDVAVSPIAGKVDTRSEPRRCRR
jgi:cysteine desulfurase